MICRCLLGSNQGPRPTQPGEVGGCEASIIKDHDTLSDPCLLDARTRESTLEKFAAKMTGGRRDINVSKMDVGQFIWGSIGPTKANQHIIVYLPSGKLT